LIRRRLLLNIPKWINSEEAYIRGNNFTVAVKHWIDSFGKHHWNVYAHIFPGHSIFEGLENRLSGCPLPLHDYCSYSHFDFNAKGLCVCKSFGSDYAHLNDDYTRVSDIELTPVMADAHELYAFLECYQKEGPDATI
jgi:hypothetical protein